MSFGFLHAEVRQPVKAGSFYPADPAELRQDLAQYLAATKGEKGTPLAIIVPHAGYIFSGATAGKAFARWNGYKAERVILLGPSHTTSFSGGALPALATTAFATPLGKLPIDKLTTDALRKFAQFSGPAVAHDREHCLEVELPFIQSTLGEIPIVPIIVGAQTDQSMARAMARRLSDVMKPGTVIVVSSDFTHHGRGYDHAPFANNSNLTKKLVNLGELTAGRAVAIDPRGFSEQVETSGDTVCGAKPIVVLLELLSHAFEGRGELVEVTTSTEVSRSFDQVVTYAAAAFQGAWKPWREDAPPPPLNELTSSEKKAVLALARATLETYLTHDAQLARWFSQHPITGNLAARSGVFVTIHRKHVPPEERLRGCIGVIEAREPLVDAIVHSATSAANDPRFPPLAANELERISLEVSALSPMHQAPGPESIVLGKHGVLLGKAGRHAVFLPQVATETGWDLETFLSQLSRKAGLPRDAWREGATFEIFTAQVFGEEE